MARIEKTVFISYRRTNAPWALAIYQNLRQHGYDVFFDYTGIDSGDFEQAIVGNIKARAHFVVLLTPSALERCHEPGDWLRREIETAFEYKRNIVPLRLEGFDYAMPSIASQLTGTLEPLRSYNALSVPVEYFDEAMDRLRNRFLNVTLDGILHPAPATTATAANAAQQAADAAPQVKEKELTAQEWFERGYAATDHDEEIRLFTEAILLKADYPEAFYNRGWARQQKGDLDEAIKDYDEAIRLKPDYAAAFNNRGLARIDKGYFDAAIIDLNEAIRLQPDYALAFINRGIARNNKGDYDDAIIDLNEAIRLKPNNPIAFNNRGNPRHHKGEYDAAVTDYTEAIRLKPDYALAFSNRAISRRNLGELEGAKEDEAEATRLKYLQSSPGP
ncbi:MAG: tetratricopeptide repeat protein [Acidobacteriota bacterium]